MIPSYHDYESFGYLNLRLPGPEPLHEAYAGTAIVGWHGRIETQLVNLLNDAVKGRNNPYADKLREFLKIWRANEITGSINRETIEILKSATDILGVDEWDMSNYFRSLRDSLKIIIASEEQLPRGAEEPGNEPMAGGGGGAGGPPMSPDFGPEETPPGGAGGVPEEMPGGEGGSIPGEEMPGGELEGAPGAELEGAPGAELGAPEPGENSEEPIDPEEMPNDELGLA